MYVSVRHVRYILHHRPGHITSHMSRCAAHTQSRESADQLKLSGGARVQPQQPGSLTKWESQAAVPLTDNIVTQTDNAWTGHYEHYADPTESDVQP